MYSIGDILQANCTSYSSIPAASLQWYIEGEEATQRMLLSYPVQYGRRGRQTTILRLRYVHKDDPQLQRIFTLEAVQNHGT